MPTPQFYPTPDNPTGFVVYNQGAKSGAIIYLHGIGEIGPGTLDPWGLPGFVSEGPTGMNGVPPDLINYGTQNDMAIVAPRCDRPSGQGGWSHAMVDNVLNHPAVKVYSANTFHLIGFSLGAGEAANYMLASIANASKFATAFVCHTTSVSGTYSNIVNGKVKVVGLGSSTDGTTPAVYTNNFIDGINAAGGSAIKNIFPSGGHGGELPEVYRGTKYSWLGGMNMYEYMKANPRAGGTPIVVIKTISKVVITYSDGSTQEVK